MRTKLSQTVVGAIIVVLVGASSPAHSFGLAGFVYDNGTYTTLIDPAGVETFAFGINNLGQVVGSFNNCVNCGNQNGFLYSNGTYTTLNVPGATLTVPRAINDSGQIVGYYYSGTAFAPFLYSNGPSRSDLRKRRTSRLVAQEAEGQGVCRRISAPLISMQRLPSRCWSGHSRRYIRSAARSVVDTPKLILRLTDTPLDWDRD